MHPPSPLAATLRELDAQVIEQNPAALCVYRAPLGEILRFNTHAVRLWGRQPDPGERVTGAWRTRHLDGRLMPLEDSPFEAVLRGGAAIRDCHLTIERPDGSSVAVTACVSPLQDEGGQLVGAVSAFSPIHTLSATGDDIELLDGSHLGRDQDTALGDLLGSALIGVWSYDVRTRHAVRSLTHDQIHGYAGALSEWTFDTFVEHAAPDQRERLRSRFDESLVTGEAVFDCRIIRPDGSPAWIWSRGRVMRDDSGTPVRIVGIVMDVTRHRVETEALTLERRRREVFVATLAHELRQPLSAMLAAIEVARLAPASAAIVRATDVMRRQVGQMTRVIEDLMDATRWAEGRMSIRRQRIDLRDVIGVSVQDVGAIMADRGHELVVVETTEPVWVNGDPQRLQQVLSNLLRNAAKYTNTGGRIAVDVDRGPLTVALRVSDNGIGIENDALVYVFDLFSQVRPSQVTGLGIGLSIVREIVAMHGGDIQAHSKGAGLGSEFVVTLPLAPPPTYDRDAD